MSVSWISYNLLQMDSYKPYSCKFCIYWLFYDCIEEYVCLLLMIYVQKLFNILRQQSKRFFYTCELTVCKQWLNLYSYYTFYIVIEKLRLVCKRFLMPLSSIDIQRSLFMLYFYSSILCLLRQL